MEYNIGKFKIKSGNVVIGDPYHTHLVDANINIFKVKKGTWNCKIRKDTDNIIYELVALHKTINFNNDDSQFYWENDNHFVEVDSEIVGIFDINSFCCDAVLDKVNFDDIIDAGDNIWINYCLTKVFNLPNASVIPNGVISKVNTRKDFYDILTITDYNEKCIGLKILFKLNDELNEELYF